MDMLVNAANFAAATSHAAITTHSPNITPASNAAGTNVAAPLITKLPTETQGFSNASFTPVNNQPEAQLLASTPLESPPNTSPARASPQKSSKEPTKPLPWTLEEIYNINLDILASDDCNRTSEGLLLSAISDLSLAGSTDMTSCLTPHLARSSFAEMMKLSAAIESEEASLLTKRHLTNYMAHLFVQQWVDELLSQQEVVHRARNGIGNTMVFRFGIGMGWYWDRRKWGQSAQLLLDGKCLVAWDILATVDSFVDVERLLTSVKIF
ncbi:MAG: hypothetical protein M1829_000408 [Trizodia sp. TS-e1964]|nr:MAG: hypothetical protein M1829_000408 [Trizodia sp. TS-e1964]